MLEKLSKVSPPKIQATNIQNGSTKEIFKYFDIDYPDFEEDHTNVFVVSIIKNNEFSSINPLYPNFEILKFISTPKGL